MMAYKSLCVCFVVCTFLLKVLAINYYNPRETEKLENIAHQSWLENKLVNVSMSNKTYIFMGKVLKAFYARQYSELEDSRGTYSIPEKLEHAINLIFVVKAMRIFQGNNSVITPFKNVLIINMSPDVCYLQKKTLPVFISDRCIVLIFAKMISYNVFKAELILAERAHEKIKIKNAVRKLRRPEFRRSRKGT